MNERKSLIFVIMLILVVVGGLSTLYFLFESYTNPQPTTEQNQMIVNDTEEAIISNEVKELNSKFRQEQLIESTVKKLSLQNNFYYQKKVEPSDNKNVVIFNVSEYIQNHGLHDLNSAQQVEFKKEYVKIARKDLVDGGCSNREIQQIIKQLKFPGE